MVALSLNYSLYDCFSDEVFHGHVAAVVEVSQEPDMAFAQKIATELCQTITCFVWKENGCIWVKSIAKDGSVLPVNHGLLGVAKRFFNENILGGSVLTCTGAYKSKCIGSEISISLPKMSLENAEVPDRLSQAFDVIPVSVCDVRNTCVIELRTVDDLKNLSPDINRIAKLEYNRIVLTAEDSSGRFDYVCRCFSPKQHINEDNGSLYIQTFLPLFWQDRLGKNDFSFLQLSPRLAMGKAFVKDDEIEVIAAAKLIFSGVLRLQ